MNLIRLTLFIFMLLCLWHLQIAQPVRFTSPEKQSLRFSAVRYNGP